MSMNYQPVVIGNQPNDNTGIKENLDAGKVGKEIISSQQYALLPLWSISLQDPQNTDDDIADAAFDVKENENDVYVSANGTLTSPSVNAISLNFGIARKYSFVDPFTYLDDPDILELEDIVYLYDEEDVGTEADLSNLETNIPVSPIPTTRFHRDHPVNQIIEPNKVHQAIKDSSWNEDMQEELLQFKLQKVWVLVDLPKCKRAIGSKWVFRNKKDERGIVIWNKARLVAQGHTQEEGIDCDEVFALVAKIEAIRLFLAYASFMGFMVYQMDIKSAFIYETIKEVVYVCQPLIFEDPDYPDKVYKVFKELYGLHQALRACNYAGASLDMKSTTGGYQFLGCRLISWQCKKQTVVATSSTEAEYVVAASYCAQVRWIQNQLRTTSIQESGTSVLEDLKALSWKTCQEVIAVKLMLLGHKLMQSKCLSAKRTTWNKFSCSMASVVICLATVVMDNQVDDMTSHKPRYTSPALTHKVFANMRRVGKGFLGVETLLFASMLDQPTTPHESSIPLLTTLMETCATLSQKVAEKMHPNKGKIEAIDADEGITLVDVETQEEVVTMDNLRGEQVQERHLDNIKKYQSLKKKPIFIAQARKNMVINLKNMAGYKMEHFRGMTYDKESFEKLREVEVLGSKSTQKIPSNDPKEMTKEDVQNMLEIVPVFEFKVKALQVKYPIIDWEIYTEGAHAAADMFVCLVQAYGSYLDYICAIE
uniref:Putative ribonuclease H-like domain-containing protein n=1 Tax=Tanacetum cinerariifolium TaxID=118510 RepID=A0A6L2MJG6_TANCI|nr:putative ribonuclease H-like domain-containing protein [Tanacetum cinerariifolium]